jgi:hypothetical protein
MKNQGKKQSKPLTKGERKNRGIVFLVIAAVCLVVSASLPQSNTLHSQTEVIVMSSLRALLVGCSLVLLIVGIKNLRAGPNKKGIEQENQPASPAIPVEPLLNDAEIISANKTPDPKQPGKTGITAWIILAFGVLIAGTLGIILATGCQNSQPTTPLLPQGENSQPTTPPLPQGENSTWTVKIEKIEEFWDPQGLFCSDCSVTVNNSNNSVVRAANGFTFLIVTGTITNKTTETRQVSTIYIGITLSTRWKIVAIS